MKIEHSQFHSHTDVPNCWATPSYGTIVFMFLNFQQYLPIKGLKFEKVKAKITNTYQIVSYLLGNFSAHAKVNQNLWALVSFASPPSMFSSHNSLISFVKPILLSIYWDSLSSRQHMPLPNYCIEKKKEVRKHTFLVGMVGCENMM